MEREWQNIRYTEIKELLSNISDLRDNSYLSIKISKGQIDSVFSYILLLLDEINNLNVHINIKQNETDMKNINRMHFWKVGKFLK